MEFVLTVDRLWALGQTRCAVQLQFVERSGQSLEPAVGGDEVQVKRCPVCKHESFHALTVVGF